jgi:hypothetical protein
MQKSVNEKLLPYIYSKERLIQFRELKASIFEEIELKIFLQRKSQLTEEEIKEAESYILQN